MDSGLDMGVFVAIGAVIVVLVALAVFVVSRYQIAKPTEAIIVSGKSRKEIMVEKRDSQGNVTQVVSADLSDQKVVIGSGVFVVPFIQASHRIILESQSIEVGISKVPSLDGILLDVNGVAIIKVGGTQEAVRLAAQRFGSGQKALEEIKRQTIETLSGALRGIVGKMDIKEIISDRERFAQETVDIAQTTLANQGLALDTFQISNILDTQGYIDNLGRREAAELDKSSKIAEQDALKQSELNRIAVERELAEQQRELSIQKATIQQETDRRASEANAAKPLEDSRQKQLILDETLKIAERQSAVREKELEATVRKESDAKRYGTEQDAEARKTASILDAEARQTATIRSAEADAKESELKGQGQVYLAEANARSQEAEARGKLALAKTEAEAIRIKGESEASAITAKGLAEAEAMEKRAEAFKQYNDAAIVNDVLKTLPAIAVPFAEAYKGISNLTIIDSDGTSKLGRSVADNMSQALAAGDALGINFEEIIKGITGNFSTKSGENTPNTVEGTVIN